MRILIILLLATSVQAALLEDATGDVQASHCEQQATPVAGWEAMDLVQLDINETPEQILFSVTAAGLEREADYDAGNYFVYLARGTTFYAMRMFQENQGTGAIAELYLIEGRHDQFGVLIEQFPADIVGNTITAAVDRELLLDDEGSIPVRGQMMTEIVASAEAHATGFYGCSFDGNDGGPYIIQDTMPDGLEGGASWTFEYGGGRMNGPIEVHIERPYRASNGEATTYTFEVAVANLDDQVHSYDIDGISMPPGWSLHLPNATLRLEAGADRSFDVLVSVPFRHQHGVTERFDLQVRSQQEPTVQGHFELGVQYLATPQPSGHHPTVYLHAKSGLGPDEAAGALGQGANELYFNTLEEDPHDQDLEIQAEVFPGAQGRYRWMGCLSPRLAMGLAPGVNETTFELTLRSDVELTGDLTGAILRIVGERGPSCQDGSLIGGETLATLHASVDGASVDGVVTRVFDSDIPFAADSDLLLVLELHPDRPTAAAEAPFLVDGRIDLPLEDHHEAAPASSTPEAEDAEVEAAREKQSPLPLWLAFAVLLRRR